MAHSTTIIVMAILSVFYLCNLVSSASDNVHLNLGAFNCPSTRKPSISYKNNINILLSDFISQSSKRDYYMASTGNSPDMVFGYYMCRRDLKREACQNCIANATEFIRFPECEYKDGTFISPKCVFKYASQSMYGLWNRNIYKTLPLGDKVSNIQQYNQTLSPTIEGLVNEAAFGSDTNGSILRGFATKEANITGGKKIYSLAQCTPDIVGVECSRCLREALADLWSDNEGYQGGEVTTANCLLRYDNKSFYDLEVVKMKPNESDIMPPKLGDLNPNTIDGLKPPNLVFIYSALILMMYYTCTVS